MVPTLKKIYLKKIGLMNIIVEYRYGLGISLSIAMHVLILLEWSNLFV